MWYKTKETELQILYNMRICRMAYLTFVKKLTSSQFSLTQKSTPRNMLGL